MDKQASSNYRRPVIANKSTNLPSMNKVGDNVQAGGTGAQAPRFTVKRTTSIQKPPDNQRRQAVQRNASVAVGGNMAKEIEAAKKEVDMLESEAETKKERLQALLEMGRNMGISNQGYAGEHETLLRDFRRLDDEEKQLNSMKGSGLSEISTLQAKEKDLRKKWQELRKPLITRKKPRRV